MLVQLGIKAAKCEKPGVLEIRVVCRLRQSMYKSVVSRNNNKDFILEKNPLLSRRNLLYNLPQTINI